MESTMSSKSDKPQKKGNSMHQKAWRSMRILRQWSIPAVVSTIEGGTVCSVAKFVKALERHGMVEKLPGYKKGRAGDHQIYRIYQKLSDQPVYPQICDLCGQLISAKICEPEKKETERQTQGGKGSKRTEASRALYANQPLMSLEEVEQAEAELYPQEKTQRETSADGERELTAAGYPDQGWHVVPGELKRRLTGGHRDAA
jgi:hypothetical protein